MSLSNRELFARLIECEAGGEGDIGMKAVATVIMNRVNSTAGEYAEISQGGNIRNIIFQPYQFTCAKEVVGGDYNSQNIYNINATQEDYDIADWAIAGNKIGDLGLSLWYMNPYNPQCPAYFPYNKTGVIQDRINEHCFYNPTLLYYET